MNKNAVSSPCGTVISDAEKAFQDEYSRWKVRALSAEREVERLRAFMRTVGRLNAKVPAGGGGDE